MLEKEEEHGHWKILFRIGLESQFPGKTPNLLGFTMNVSIFIKIRDDKERQVWLVDPNQDPPT